MKNHSRKILVIFLLFSFFTWLAAFNKIEVVAPGKGITSITQSDVVIKAPTSAYVVSIGASQGETVVPGKSMLVYRNLEDEYRLKQLKESLISDQQNYKAFKSERCFLNSSVFEDAIKEQKHYDVECPNLSYKGGAGGFYILQYYEDYLLEKSYFNEVSLERQKRMDQLLNKQKILLKKRKALKRGQGATIRFYDLESEISDLQNELVAFDIGGLENEKQVSDKFSTFELRRSERLLTIEEKLEKLDSEIIDKKHQLGLLNEKTELSVIRSPVTGTVLKMTDGLSRGTYIEEASPLFVLKKEGASQNVLAKFDTRYRHFLKVGRFVNLKIDSVGYNKVFKGVITEISSDAIDHEDQAKAGQRYYRVNIKPEKDFVDQSLNLGIDVSVTVVTDQITPLEYIASVFPNTIKFNVW